ncbi:hypothetical protein BDZ97DRAFT_1925962 [Flammula alnicola]|nr:hypothetical protein BDZ97DRAFT_1925962 [Flammula alnicola]
MPEITTYIYSDDKFTLLWSVDVLGDVRDDDDGSEADRSEFASQSRHSRKTPDNHQQRFEVISNHHHPPSPLLHPPRPTKPPPRSLRRERRFPGRCVPLSLIEVMWAGSGRRWEGDEGQRGGSGSSSSNGRAPAAARIRRRRSSWEVLQHDGCRWDTATATRWKQQQQHDGCCWSDTATTTGTAAAARRRRLPVYGYGDKVEAAAAAPAAAARIRDDKGEQQQCPTAAAQIRRRRRGGKSSSTTAAARIRRRGQVGSGSSSTPLLLLTDPTTTTTRVDQRQHDRRCRSYTDAATRRRGGSSSSSTTAATAPIRIRRPTTKWTHQQQHDSGCCSYTATATRREQQRPVRLLVYGNDEDERYGDDEDERYGDDEDRRYGDDEDGRYGDDDEVGGAPARWLPLGYDDDGKVGAVAAARQLLLGYSDEMEAPPAARALLLLLHYYGDNKFNMQCFNVSTPNHSLHFSVAPFSQEHFGLSAPPPRTRDVGRPLAKPNLATMTPSNRQLPGRERARRSMLMEDAADEHEGRGTEPRNTMNRNAARMGYQRVEGEEEGHNNHTTLASKALPFRCDDIDFDARIRTTTTQPRSTPESRYGRHMYVASLPTSLHAEEPLRLSIALLYLDCWRSQEGSSNEVITYPMRPDSTSNECYGERTRSASTSFSQPPAAALYAHHQASSSISQSMGWDAGSDNRLMWG